MSKVRLTQDGLFVLDIKGLPVAHISPDDICDALCALSRECESAGDALRAQYYFAKAQRFQNTDLWQMWRASIREL